MNSPLLFTPFLRPMVWGGRRLGAFLEQPLPPGVLYGEAWLVSDHPLHRSVVARGPLSGRSLRQPMETDRAGLLGPAAAHEAFPWLIKCLDVRDRLSVQVHPDAQAARRLLPGEGSKTEAWFVLDAEPGSRVYAGLRPGTDQQVLLECLRRGAVPD